MIPLRVRGAWVSAVLTQKFLKKHIFLPRWFMIPLGCRALGLLFELPKISTVLRKAYPRLYTKSTHYHPES